MTVNETLEVLRVALDPRTLCRCYKNQEGGEPDAACPYCDAILKVRQGFPALEQALAEDPEGLRASRDGLALQVQLLRSQVEERDAAVDLACAEARKAMERAEGLAARCAELDEQARACAAEVMEARASARRCADMAERAAALAGDGLLAVNRLELGITRALSEMAARSFGWGVKVADELRNALTAPEVDPGAPAELAEATPDLTTGSRESLVRLLTRVLWRRGLCVLPSEDAPLSQVTGLAKLYVEDVRALVDALEQRLCRCPPELRGGSMTSHFVMCPARALWLAGLPVLHPQAPLQVTADMAHGRGRR